MPCNIYKDNDRTSLESIKAVLLAKNICILTGGYGIGKSLTLGNLFVQLMNDYNSGITEMFPIFIDLKKINAISDFNSMNQLLQQHFTELNNQHYAFDVISPIIESENCIMIFDGLDEISLINNNKNADRLLDKKKRFEILKEFLHRRKGKQGIIISSRDNFFFDFEKKIKEYLNFDVNEFLHYNLNEFSSEDAIELFKKYCSDAPENFPYLKPLLIVKMAIRDLLNPRDNLESFAQIIDSIISREYNGHFSSNDEITEAQFKRIIYEIISVSMTHSSYDTPITEKMLTDIYNYVTERNPTTIMQNELKKLMIFNMSDETKVYLFDEKIVDSICARIMTDISGQFIDLLRKKSHPYKNSYDEILNISIDNTKYNKDCLRKWKRMLVNQDGEQELFEYLYMQGWYPTSFSAYLNTLINQTMSQFAFILLQSYNAINLESNIMFTDITVDKSIDTSIFRKLNNCHIYIINSIIEHVNLHSSKNVFLFKRCILMRVSFKDNPLLYKGDIKRHSIDSIFDDDCEFALEDEPKNIAKIKSNETIQRKYREKKAGAIFECFRQIHDKGTLNRRYFEQNLQNKRISTKDINWALRKIVSFGYFSIYLERGNTMYKKEKSEEIKKAITNSELPKEFKRYFREQ
jgi:hypothetical protein